MPVYRSFDEAWSDFVRTVMVTPFEESASALSHGRAQAIAFTVPVHDLALLSEIERLQDTLGLVPGLSLVPPEDLHITVKVAGFQVVRRTLADDLLREEVPTVDKLATAYFRDVARFGVRLVGVCIFPGCVVVEVSDGGVLRRLNAELAEHISLLHRYPTDGVGYLPHLTVALIEDGTDPIQVRDTVAPHRQSAFGELAVTRIDLSRAWFISGGAESEVIKSYFLR